MARHPHGLSISDYIISVGTDGQAVLASGSTITFWTDETGGSQYTDLALDSGGTSPVTSATSEDGTGDIARGQWATIWGPDGVLGMWASADSGPRAWILPRDLPDLISDLVTAGNFADNYTALGDLVAGSGGSGSVATVTVGTDGQVLTADSTKTGGIKWATPSGGGDGGGTVTSVNTVTPDVDGDVTLAPDDIGAQAQDDDLDAIAALTPAANDVMQFVSSAWTNRTPAQVKTSLSLTATDVALGNVNNTADADKPVSSAAQTALDAKAPLASPALTGTATAEGLSVTKKIATPAVALTDAATIATDASAGSYFRVTLGGNRTLGIPTSPSDGQTGLWEFIQDATGSRTLTLTTSGTGCFALGSDISAVTLSTGASKRDFMIAKYNSTAARWFVLGFVKGY